MKPRRRRGMVMLQTLVMSVILSMIAAMVMKWVLSRYVLAARDYRATEAAARIKGVTAHKMSYFWNYANLSTIPTSDFMTVDGKSVSYSRSGVTASGTMQFTVTIDEE
ncbi:MAG: hypothetical protein M0011_12175 [Elusimicrobia bacterium]|nr:hypothetical protein [Elusimicrobiota bacterium]